jgi:hypothetical protein
MAISEDRCTFLMNPNGRHFSRVRASELLLLDARDEFVLESPAPRTPPPGACMRTFAAACRDTRGRAARSCAQSLGLEAVQYPPKVLMASVDASVP